MPVERFLWSSYAPNLAPENLLKDFPNTRQRPDSLLSLRVSGSRRILKLLVAGRTVRSQLAIQRIAEACKNYPEKFYHLEVLDVVERPEVAEQYRILATPTLLRLAPLPTLRLVGDLDDLPLLQRILEADPGEEVVMSTASQTRSLQ